MCSRCLLEVCVDFLDKDGLGLGREHGLAYDESIVTWALETNKLTWMLPTHSDVKLVIRDPDTPGGLRLSMA